MAETKSTPAHPHHTHHEHHFGSNAFIRDVVIGMADGLTVPFALAAGLSGALSSTHLVVIAGLAEIAAGSIAMGLGGFLAARGDEEHFAAELVREHQEIIDLPDVEAEEIVEVLGRYGISRAASLPVVRELEAQPKHYVDFMMRFELGLETPEPGRAWKSALTIAGSYIVGGFIPLAPYMLIGHDLKLALQVSIAVTLIALVIFGAAKGKALGTGVLRSAVQTTLIGGAAAAAAFALAKVLNAA